MDDETYQRELEKLRSDWGELHRDPSMPGVLRASNDPSTGIMVGMRAPIIQEIINRALKERP